LSTTTTEHDGHITIVRTQSNVRDDYIVVSLIDPETNRSIKVEITPHDFAMAVTGRSEVPCKIRSRAVREGRSPREKKS